MKDEHARIRCVRFGTQALSTKQRSTKYAAHWLPCNVAWRGELRQGDVEEYFLCTDTLSEKDSSQTASGQTEQARRTGSFRGRRLRARELNLSEMGFEAAVCDVRVQSPGAQAESPGLQAFDSTENVLDLELPAQSMTLDASAITVWAHDLDPKVAEGSLLQAAEWLSAMQALHSD
ncbi:hypothetical protein FVE85_6807 [Porphyridium purpureum]|uniref:Uncharacterized protein n=1 Tax=Porphyridium purpureum TaxID=35688 RepID=A0A5J4Z850_PORPP|nr:hypothetical protein FVE85_6807 [Porphyridium purpureum]|eukprot:POR3885..scf295_1